MLEETDIYSREKKNRSELNPVVSIITPIFNAEKFLEETLQSILDQTFEAWEAILVDDGSTDNSASIAQAFVAKDSRFMLISKKFSDGAARARNDAIKLAKGRYIAFLDSDDIWLPEKLYNQIEFMKSKNIVLSFTSYFCISEDGKYIGTVKASNRLSYSRLLRGNSIACLTAIYDTKSLGKVYMPDIIKRQDFGLWLEITRRGFYAEGLDMPLAKYRIRKGSISSNKWNASLYTWRLYRDVEGLSRILSIYLLGSHLSRALLIRISSYFD